MKKLFVLFILLLSCSLYGTAQNNYAEVVYLKNGSIIRGVVIEQVPNVSLKVKTADGSVFAYQMADVEKITKEERASATNVYQANKRSKSTLKGYKAFVDAGYTFDVSGYNASKFEVSTSHGYQFNNYLYLGGGMAFDYYADADAFALPMFANFRANFAKSKVAPFGDVKLGYTVGDVTGAYFTLGVGVRLAVKKKSAVNFRLEYTCQGDDFSTYYYSESVTMSGIGFKVGYEF